MALISRLAVLARESAEPEDILGESLAVIFPDDVMVQHGDPDHALMWTSPHLPRPLRLARAEPPDRDDRYLFSHYLWNASLLLAELVEAGTLGVPLAALSGLGAPPPPRPSGGSGTGTSARRRSDEAGGVEYAEKEEAGNDDTDSENGTRWARNVAANLPLSPPAACPAEVHGHEWGDLSSPFAARNRGAFDRVMSCDSLWMPWQHANLRRSVGWFLAPGPEARAWVVACFDTGRVQMRDFFDAEALRADAGLEVERIRERGCDGVEREWVWGAGPEDVSERKRWLVVAVLRRVRD
ncbi:hypothetical protein DL764_010275 [Monosporascus ibericus]|uniref:Uncharacterized protein n=1 Tax=Monosporascus ibericus TaxID=155417 RepID=A0A4Q4SV76_9PEZI|nr:hypothetical protein DL764_010275 [Monosporascus ibericus]